MSTSFVTEGVMDVLGEYIVGSPKGFVPLYVERLSDFTQSQNENSGSSLYCEQQVHDSSYKSKQTSHETAQFENHVCIRLLHVFLCLHRNTRTTNCDPFATDRNPFLLLNNG